MINKYPWLFQYFKLPNILVPLDVKAVEVIVFDESLLLCFVFAVLQALHDRQLHLHGDVDGQHRLQQVLLQTHTHRHTHRQKQEHN
mgnify:CR=1 FL=1